MVSDSRADNIADRLEVALVWFREVTTGVRQWMKRSEHAPLIVAVSLGIVLIALLIAVASAITSNGTQQAASTTSSTASSASTSPTGAAPPSTPSSATTSNPVKVNAPAPMLAPGKVHLQIVNIGRRKGYAAQFANRLKAKGYPIDSVGNSKSGFGSPVIMCPKALSREQALLSKQSGITTLDTLPAGGAAQSCVIAVA